MSSKQPWRPFTGSLASPAISPSEARDAAPHCHHCPFRAPAGQLSSLRLRGFGDGKKPSDGITDSVETR